MIEGKLYGGILLKTGFKLVGVIIDEKFIGRPSLGNSGANFVGVKREGKLIGT